MTADMLKKRTVPRYYIIAYESILDNGVHPIAPITRNAAPPYLREHRFAMVRDHNAVITVEGYAGIVK